MNNFRNFSFFTQYTDNINTTIKNSYLIQKLLSNKKHSLKFLHKEGDKKHLL